MYMYIYMYVYLHPILSLREEKAPSSIVATNCPPVINMLFITTSLPLKRARADSAMYIGTAMAASPIPNPTITLPRRRIYLSGATPITTAPTVKIKDASVSTGLQPSSSVSGPAATAAKAAAPIVTATINSCHRGSSLK